jgi:tetratricopeptide (TPR) repeat protein
MKALAIDPGKAYTHVMLASISMFRDNDLAAAARHFEQAMALQPNNDSVLSNAAGLLLTLGRKEQAVALQEYVTSLDPLNASRFSNLGTYYFYSRRWDEAIAAYRTTLRLSPGARQIHYSIALALMLKGQPAAALEEVAEELDEDAALQARTMALYSLGRQPELEASLAEAVERFADLAPSWLAQIYAWSGDTEAAFAWLAKAAEQNESGLAGQFLEPYYDSIRADPRWADFLERTGSSPRQRDAISFSVTLPE